MGANQCRDLAKIGDAMPGTVLATARTEFDAGVAFDLHEHPFHLLSWSETATVTHRTADRDWLVPPTHALWI